MYYVYVIYHTLYVLCIRNISYIVCTMYTYYIIHCMYYVYILYHTLYTCLVQIEVHNIICTVLLHPQTSETITLTGTVQQPLLREDAAGGQAEARRSMYIQQGLTQIVCIAPGQSHVFHYRVLTGVYHNLARKTANRRLRVPIVTWIDHAGRALVQPFAPAKRSTGQRALSKRVQLAGLVCPRACHGMYVPVCFVMYCSARM